MGRGGIVVFHGGESFRVRRSVSPVRDRHDKRNHLPYVGNGEFQARDHFSGG